MTVPEMKMLALQILYMSSGLRRSVVSRLIFTPVFCFVYSKSSLHMLACLVSFINQMAAKSSSTSPCNFSRGLPLFLVSCIVAVAVCFGIL